MCDFRAKHDAWNRLGNMPKEVAMQKYVDELKKVSRMQIDETYISISLHFHIETLLHK